MNRVNIHVGCIMIFLLKSALALKNNTTNGDVNTTEVMEVGEREYEKKIRLISKVMNHDALYSSTLELYEGCPEPVQIEMNRKLGLETQSLQRVLERR